jgi:hypothetical protein
MPRRPQRARASKSAPGRVQSPRLQRRRSPLLDDFVAERLHEYERGAGLLLSGEARENLARLLLISDFAWDILRPDGARGAIRGLPCGSGADARHFG